MFRGRPTAVLSGEHAHADAVVIRFPSTAALAGWHASAAYQSLIPLREQAAELVLVAYDAGISDPRSLR